MNTALFSDVTTDNSFGLQHMLSICRIYTHLPRSIDTRLSGVNDAPIY